MTGILVIMLFGRPFGGVIPGAQGAVLSTLMRTGTPLTGRQVHGLLANELSLWTVQESLKALTALGLVDTQTVGRAGLHSVNEGHYAVAPLRLLLSPLAVLTEVVREVLDAEVKAAIVFGSVARGEAGSDSDVDLAVIAKAGWDQRTRLQEHVKTRLGNDCDVVVFTATEFARLASTNEPVVAAILADGVPLIGSLPRTKPRIA